MIWTCTWIIYIYSTYFQAFSEVENFSWIWKCFDCSRIQMKH